MGKHAFRGVLSAWLGLIVLRAVGDAASTGKVGTLVSDVNAVITRALSPNVAAIPDRRGARSGDGGPNYTGGLTPGQFTAGVAGLPAAVALGTPAGQAAMNDPNGILGQLSGLNLGGIANLGAYSGLH